MKIYVFASTDQVQALGNFEGGWYSASVSMIGTALNAGVQTMMSVRRVGIYTPQV